MVILIHPNLPKLKFVLNATQGALHVILEDLALLVLLVSIIKIIKIYNVDALIILITIKETVMLHALFLPIDKDQFVYHVFKDVPDVLIKPLAQYALQDTSLQAMEYALVKIIEAFMKEPA